ncbi:oligosaccharide flippase family protein [Patescibacteria group bacterium]|nr:oligosaccharide flippase family protein [Patescibacteria group bacterium]
MTNPEKNYSFLKTYIKGEALIGFWNIISKGLGGISSILIIANLDVYKYGVFLLVISFYSLIADLFLGTLVGLVFNDINRFIGEKKEEKAKKLFKEFFIIRGIIAIILFLSVFFGADLVANFYGQDIAILFKILSPLFIIDFFYVSMRNLLQSRLYFGLTSFRPILYKAVRLIFILSFVFFFVLDAKNLLIAHVVSSFLVTVVFVSPFIKAYKPWKTIKESSDKIFLNIIKTYGKWPIFSNFLSQASSNIQPWFIRFFVNTEAVAVFSVAESLFSAVKALFPVATLSTLIPREVSSKKRIGDLLIRGTKYLTIFGILLGIVGFFAVPPMVKIFFPSYESSIPLFKVLLLLLPIMSFRSLSSTFLVALRRQKFIFFSNIFKNVLSFILPALFLYLFGVLGLAIERIIFSIIIGGLMYVYLLKKEVHPSFWAGLFSFNEQDKVFVKNLYQRSISFAKKSIFPGC